MLPDLILDKISWYLWKIKQTMICQEYYMKILGKRYYLRNLYTDNQIFIYDFNCEPIRINYKDISYNNYEIYNFKKSERTKIIIPENYWYSSGLNSLNGYKKFKFDE